VERKITPHWGDPATGPCEQKACHLLPPERTTP
jgi:hypothetical protein